MSRKHKKRGRGDRAVLLLESGENVQIKNPFGVINFFFTVSRHRFLLSVAIHQ